MTNADTNPAALTTQDDDQWLLDLLDEVSAEREIEEAKALTAAQTAAADALKAAEAAIKAAADAMTAAAAAAEQVAEMTGDFNDEQAHWSLEDTAATLNNLTA